MNQLALIPVNPAIADKANLSLLNFVKNSLPLYEAKRNYSTKEI
ncbi:MAG: hypothetical protein V7K48_33095 [Nostoc sp.]